MVQNKSFRGYLVLNWKNGAVRVIRKKPQKESPYEISVAYDIKIEIPEKPQAKVEEIIEMPQAKINQAIAEEI